ncbi:hypothetical protein [Paraburkholderia sp. BL17N1]|uniref:hypothetical protein n=1 Tax=Paraburkholderia sp. BL17N1 TaxID=1938798 RepID=UPI000EB067DC|nr:hypothetical protein [Paraburkholderia sp. BL17N1]RKR46312.1 hypothetical protein B0G82_3995 [Paraburkholderia sp. BL17N1]
MADVQDVLDTVAAQLAGFVYPSGTGNASVTGKDINVFPGWPLPGQVDIDMPQGIADVSVYATPTERNTTRYRPKQKVMSIAQPTLTLTAATNVVTVGGAMPSPFTPHNLAVLIDGCPFIYPVQSTDTLTSIATGLATLIAVKYPGTSSSGPNVTINDAALVFTASGAQVVDAQGNLLIADLSPVNPTTTRVGTTGSVTTEWERQAQIFQITVWAPDPVTRKTIGNAIKVALSQIAFITMPDGYGARIRYHRSVLSDESEKVRVYRRDLYYEIEFATTTTKQIATVVATRVKFETQDGTPILTRTY